MMHNKNIPQEAIWILITSQDWGGAQAYVFDLALELQKRKIPVVVSAGRASQNKEKGGIGGELKEKCRESNICFVDLKYMQRGINPFKNFLSLIELIFIFKKYSPQIIHLNSTMMGILASFAGKVIHIPEINYCIGGWVFNERLPLWKKKFYIFLEKLTARFKNNIICVNPQDVVLAQKLKITPKNTILNIPNGIKINEFKNNLLPKDEALKKLKLLNTKIIIGTVANAYPPKNLLWYLDICRIAYQKNKNLHFVIIGDGPLFNDLKNKYNIMNLHNFVTLTGRRMDVKELYSAFDIFVLPSTKEGMPITLLEAMTAKIPIIATDVGANKWMLNNAGIIVQPLDTEVMVHSILNLSSKPKLRYNLANRAYLKVITDFSWQKTLDKTLEVLKINEAPKT